MSREILSDIEIKRNFAPSPEDQIKDFEVGIGKPSWNNSAVESPEDLKWRGRLLGLNKDNAVGMTSLAGGQLEGGSSMNFNDPVSDSLWIESHDHLFWPESNRSQVEL